MTSAHTQRIESMWAAAKLWRRTHGYKSKDALQEYLHEFCYRYNHGKSFDGCAEERPPQSGFFNDTKIERK